VRNTVYDALQAYREWVALFEKEGVYLFHARFALGDRLTIEKEILRLFGPDSKGDQRRGKLLIATQVVEQSLDLDFDHMVTDLAPIDLLLQRSGRLQRHERGKRSVPVLGVFMPNLTENAERDWYKNFFPKAAKVYEHHGQLWLTAKWLTERRKFAMPEDARSMLESVYAEQSQALIPENLQVVEERADGEDRADASLGLLNSLNLDEGYKATMIHWQDDSNATTRLGEPTVTARLARQDGSILVPWFSKDSSHDWELSQLSVRKALIAEEDTIDSAMIIAAKDTMPDKGRYCVVIPLKESEGKWKGAVKNLRGVTVTVMYDKSTGLEVVKETDNESD
jgi:CRISPR-associated endonuclease/helicase Cas3